MKRSLIIAVAVALLIIIGAGSVFIFKFKKEPAPIACTQEAKLCPDGSYVGRTGPNCEFTKCPDVIPSGNSGIRGTVMLGPTCPVERIPPDPRCADKPYATLVTIFRASDITHEVVSTQSNEKGEFAADLTPGDYTIRAAGGSMLPRCAEVEVSVKQNSYATTTISCDSGIR